MFDLITLAGALALVSLPLASGQTSSSCDPTKESDCPTKPGLNQAQYEIDFTQPGSLQTAMANWTMTSGQATSVSNGAQFAINQQGDAPTLQSNFYIFFGMVEVTMQSAPGQGIVSSFVMESDDLDEIDWELLGSDNTQAQSNFFGKGNTTTYDRSKNHTLSSPQSSMHKYAVNWTQESTTWLIDDEVVRTVEFSDSLAVGGLNYPQTPMNIRLGSWASGDPSNSPGVVQWGGGPTDFSQAPFDFIVQSVKITNFNPGLSYKFNDQSGSFQSIQVLDVIATFSETSISSSSSSSGSRSSNSTLNNGGHVGQAPVASTITIDTQGNGNQAAATQFSGSTRTGTGTRQTGTGRSTSARLSGTATGSSRSNSTSNANAGNGIGSTITINLAGSSPTGSNSFNNSNAGSGSGGSGGGLVAAGAPKGNGTQPTITIDVGGSGGSGSGSGSGIAAQTTGVAGAAGGSAATFTMTTSTSRTTGGTAAPAQVTASSANTLVAQNVLIAALVTVLGMALAFA